MIDKIYIILRNIFKKIIFLILPQNSSIINNFVNFDIYLRGLGILDRHLRGSFYFMKSKFFYDKNSDKSIASAILTNGFYEKETLDEIRNNLFNGAVFIDGGANIGFYSILVSKIVGPRGKVICFEPTDSSYVYLIKNIKINRRKNVIVEKKAISDKDKNVFLKINKNSEENSIVKVPKIRIKNRKDIIKIQSITLDSYCKNKKLKKIDLIKLDIEGQELEAIKGSKNIIKNNKNIKIIFELNIANNKDGISNTKKIFQELKKLNFRFFKFLLNPSITITNLESKKNIEILKKITRRYNVNILASK